MGFRIICFSSLIFFACTLQNVNGQKKYSFLAGGYYNGLGVSDEVNGIGLIAGLEQQWNSFFSIELRTRYALYSFDDGTEWKPGSDGSWVPPINLSQPRLKYKLFSPQIGLVPKFHLRFDEPISLFIENELSFGLITGRFEYYSESYVKKHFSEPICYYYGGIGVEYIPDEDNKQLVIVGSIGYSTLNFKSKISKNQPDNYQGVIPNQPTGFMVNLIFKIPLKKE